MPASSSTRSCRKFARPTRSPMIRILCGIGGSSSGAIAAFGVAWHRPDKFRRVFSTVGTFVGLRGGNEYPTLIRKTEPKPIRVFLQDGKNDLDIYGGSWWNANLTMLSALQWAGYAVENAWGDGGHNGKHGGAILPDAMRWLWADFDKPIADIDQPNIRSCRIASIEGEDWELVSDGHKYTEGPAVAPDGNVYFVDGPPRRNLEGESAKAKAHRKFIDDMPGVSALMFDREGRMYCARNKAQKLTRVDPDGTRTDLASGMSCNDFVVLDHGIYFTGPVEETDLVLAARWRADRGGEGSPAPNGLIATPDKRFLLVVDAAGRYVWSLPHRQRRQTGTRTTLFVRSQPTGRNEHRRRRSHDDSGRFVVGGHQVGVQIFDQPGRTACDLESAQTYRSLIQLRLRWRQHGRALCHERNIGLSAQTQR